MSISKTKRGLCYVLGDSNDDENHVLPINAMQYSYLNSQLFTGGRDGTIKVWSKESNNPFGNHYVPDADDSCDDQSIDERLLKLETSISSNEVPITSNFKNSFKINDTHNIHFDWINDLVLVNNDNDLISCSSDLSLKHIHLSSVAGTTDFVVNKFPNVHTDYVKKLSYNVPNNRIISGGLDGKIVAWDLHTLKPISSIENHHGVMNSSAPNSVYSLANDNRNVISTGGPSHTINLFDTRQPGNSFIRKLIGHQDNVRCLLMNDQFVLSGSSDCTIKLWDLRNFKLYKNFDIHDDPVWSLTTLNDSSPLSYNQAADFRVFYSGDKGGNIIKTDLSYLSVYDNSENRYFGGFSSAEKIMIDDKMGFSTLVAKQDTPINALCIESISQDDSVFESSLFASNEMSLTRYYLPKTKKMAKYQYLRTCQEFIDNEDLLQKGLEAANGGDSDLNSDFMDLVSHFSMETSNNNPTLELQSSLSNGAIGDGLTIDNNEYSSMFLSSTGGPSTEFVNFHKSENVAQVNEYVDSTPVEILLNPVSLEQITPIPYNKKPVNEYPWSPKSIIAKRLFNNKRTLMVLYLNGEIAIWDVFICRKIKTYPYHAAGVNLTSEMLKKRLKDMDEIFQENQTYDTLNNWCEVEIRAGKLLVTITETNFNNVEIYYDELYQCYPFLSINHPDNHFSKENSRVRVTNDDRLQLSRILLNSIFHNYAIYETEFDADLREELRTNPKLKDEQISDATIKKFKIFGRKTSKNVLLSDTSASNSGANTPQESAHASLSENNHESQVSDFAYSKATSETDDSILNLLYENKASYIERYQTGNKNKTIESLLRIYTNDPKCSKDTYLKTDYLSYKPLINHNQFPTNLLIIIFENSPELGTFRDLFSFRLGDLTSLKYDSQNPSPLVDHLRSYLPKWLGLPILYDKFPIKESPKIAFQLLEYDYTALPPEKKIGGKSQRKIKHLPVLESSIKLTSHNMLRVSKILSYLTEKFESRTSEMKDKKLPTEWLVLECKGQELHNNMSLQTIKTKIWKSSSDIELRFRRKFDT